jgi:hypothetical protein
LQKRREDKGAMSAADEAARIAHPPWQAPG